jgi:hypothetical protein
MTTKPTTAAASTWKAKMEERRQIEESKVRAAAVAVNDISFPALRSTSGWGSEAPAAHAAHATDKACYSETLKAKMATMDDEEYTPGATTFMSARDQAATLAVFRHPRSGDRQFGTSRSSQYDTYYDDHGESISGPPAADGAGWNTVDSSSRRKAQPTTKSRIDYTEVEDYEDDDADADAEPNINW